MERNVVISCIISKDALSEFMLLKTSIELFHNCKWYVAVDAYCEEKISHFNNVKTYTLIKDVVFKHGVKDVSDNVDFYEMLKTKFEVTRYALSENNYTIFLDTDMVFFNPIEKEIINIINEKIVDIILTPHYTLDKVNEDRVGIYNAGMFMVNNMDLINQWEKLCNSLDNIYYEQPPLERVVENYRCMLLPINYNIGWWKFKPNFSEFRYKYLCLNNDGRIHFMSKEAVNFHLHTLKRLPYDNYGSILWDKICNLLEESDQNDYQIILDYFREHSYESL